MKLERKNRHRQRIEELERSNRILRLRLAHSVEILAQAHR